MTSNRMIVKKEIGISKMKNTLGNLTKEIWG